ncbi:UNVERIFIED_CONTAM: ROK family protein [Microbacterium sp. SLM126]
MGADISAVRDPQDRLGEMRREHSAKCAEYLRVSGPATIASIAEAVGLSKPTVKERLVDLMAAGVVRDGGTENSGGAGRPASWFSFDPAAAHVVGLDLGQHVERLAIVDLAGTVHHLESRGIDSRAPADERLESARAWVEHAQESVDIDLGSWAGIGVSLPGPITQAGSLRDPAAFQEWVGQSVHPLLAAAFDAPVLAMHDLDAAILAEHRMGAAHSVDTFVLPVLWHDIAAGIQIDGSIYSGAGRAEGEPYHLRHVRASSDRAEWHSVDAIRSLIASSGRDPRAKASFESFADTAAEQIAMLVLVLDPELVLLHGPLVDEQLLVDEVRRRIQRHTGRSDVAVDVSRFRQSSSLVGATLAVLGDASERLVGPGLRPIDVVWDAWRVPLSRAG